MGERINIYLKNKEVFRKLQATIKLLWFERYGESLSKADILIKAMEVLKDELLYDDIEGQDIYRRGGVGLQDY